MSTTSANLTDLFIGGRWKAAASGGFVEVVNPATEESVGRYPAPSIQDAEAAIAEARAAFDDGPWPRMSIAERGEYVARFGAVFSERIEEFNQAWVLESGPPIAHSRGLQGAVTMMIDDLVDRSKSLELIDERALPDGRVNVIREPIGVALVITTWNGPGLYAAMKILPALLAGCTVVVKTAEESQLTTRLLGEFFAEAGFPRGVVSILAASLEVSQHMVAHRDVDKVSLTGSVPAGRAVMAACAPRVTNVTLELGGKSAAILAEDVDVDEVMKSFIPGFIAFSGQICVALTRLVVPRSRHDEIVAALVAGLAAIRVGDPNDLETVIGPLGSRRQFERVTDYVRSGLDEGATLALGGGRTEGHERGFYFDPTVFTNVTTDMRIAQEEIFGPVLCVIPYDDLDDAVRIANDTEYGLSAAVYAKDEAVAVSIAARLRAGMVAINTAGVSLFAPFGGVKQSGFGREFGDEGIGEFLQTKSIKLS